MSGFVGFTHYVIDKDVLFFAFGRAVLVMHAQQTLDNEYEAMLSHIYVAVFDMVTVCV